MKNVIKLKENELKKLVIETIKKVLKEQTQLNEYGSVIGGITDKISSRIKGDLINGNRAEHNDETEGMHITNRKGEKISGDYGWVGKGGFKIWGFYPVAKNGKKNLVDGNGKEVLPIWVDEIKSAPVGGWLLVRIGDKYNLINSIGVLRYKEFISKESIDEKYFPVSFGQNRYWS